MEQLVNDFPSHEFPATLVCAGNRRKEQNMVKQSIGFNWGAGGVSTSVWRGVSLRSLLKRCGIYSRAKGRFTCASKAPRICQVAVGPITGPVMREVALDPSRDIILAYMQNGELLSRITASPLG